MSRRARLVSIRYVAEPAILLEQGGLERTFGWYRSNLGRIGLYNLAGVASEFWVGAASRIPKDVDAEGD